MGQVHRYSHLWDRCTCIHTYGTGTQVFTLMDQVQQVFTLMDQVHRYSHLWDRCTGIHTYGSGATSIHTYGSSATCIYTYGSGTTGIHTYGTGAQVFTLMDQVQQASINLYIFSSQQNNSRQKDQGTSNNFYFSGSN